MLFPFEERKMIHFSMGFLLAHNFMIYKFHKPFYAIRKFVLRIDELIFDGLMFFSVSAFCTLIHDFRSLFLSCYISCFNMVISSFFHHCSHLPNLMQSTTMCFVFHEF